MTHILQFDGSSLGQGRRHGPGPSSGAALLIAPDGQTSEHSVFLPSADLNEAEYWGLICGLEAAQRADISSLSIFGDSRNVIDQVLELKPLRHPPLLLLKARVQGLLATFTDVRFQWVPRRRNAAADALARACLLRKGGSVSLEATKGVSMC